MTDIQISSPKDSDWEWIMEKHAETVWSSLPPCIYMKRLTGYAVETLRMFKKIGGEG